jgi:hypothetical protein
MVFFFFFQNSAVSATFYKVVLSAEELKKEKNTKFNVCGVGKIPLYWHVRVRKTILHICVQCTRVCARAHICDSLFFSLALIKKVLVIFGHCK